MANSENLNKLPDFGGDLQDSTNRNVDISVSSDSGSDKTDIERVNDQANSDGTSFYRPDGLMS